MRDHNLYPEISTVRSAPWIQPSPRDLHHLSGWSAAQRFRSFQELACRPMGPTFIPRPAPPLWLGWNASLLFRAMVCLAMRGLPSVNGPEGRSPRTRRGYASQTEPLIRPAIGKRNPKQSPLHIRGAEREPSLWVMELIAPRSAVLFVGAERWSRLGVEAVLLERTYQKATFRWAPRARCTYASQNELLISQDFTQSEDQPSF